MDLLKLEEEALKSKIKDLYFENFSYTGSKIDFCITLNHKLFGEQNLLWAEAKKGESDLFKSFIQLILTIGKYRFYTNQTPKFIAAFDAKKIAFLEFYLISELFYRSDIDFSVTPSNHKSEVFLKLLEQLKPILNKALIFEYETKEKELKSFIKNNLTTQNLSKYKIDKNNFIEIYHKWEKEVKPSISIDWDLAKKNGILDADFYLADLLSEDNVSIKDKLATILNKNEYHFNSKKTDLGSIISERTGFKDQQKAHIDFWNLYERPPKKEFWDYIIDRRDLLVPLDVRERKGAFFTPQIWVQKAQSYLAKVLGENYQEEYVIWDCAAGTGNLLANLTESRNLYASTLDIADVKIMQELSSKRGLNLLENHIFQFDFLNDTLLDKPCENHKEKLDSACKDCQKSKLPKNLQKIIHDLQSYHSKPPLCHTERSEVSHKDSKRDVASAAQDTSKPKLIIFINPPYAEATTASTIVGTGTNKALVAKNFIGEKYKESLGGANRELFAQFFMRIYKELPACILASFAKLKYVNSQNFIKFRETFRADFKAGFLCPADSFDNVKGNFPIGFLIWDLDHKKEQK